MYINNEEIVTFLNKAQNKIAELASQIVQRNGDDVRLDLLIELLDFVESLTSEYNEIEESKLIEIVHYFNDVAELNLIPLLNIPGYVTNIMYGTESSTSDVIYTHQIVDYITETNKLIRATPHNELSGLQGGTFNEYYHLTKDEYDKLLALINPFKAPTVTISLVSSIPLPTNGVYEKGLVVSQIRVRPAIAINEGISIVKGEYLLNEELSEIRTPTSAILDWVKTVSITDTTTIKYLVSFEKGGTVTANTLRLDFAYPYFITIDTKNKVPAQLNFTKNLSKFNGSIDATVTFETGNASYTHTNPKVMYLYVPVAWGDIKAVYQDGNTNFNFITSYKRTTHSYTLIDSSVENYYLYELITPPEGTFKLTFVY
jgi:hypothetical protein